MPELPEVESARELVEKHCLGSRIVSVTATECGGGPRDGLFDDKVVGEGASEESLTAALLGRTITAAHRRGKHMWIDLSGPGPSILFHFGMYSYSTTVSVRNRLQLQVLLYCEIAIDFRFIAPWLW